ncbi:ribonuclease III [Psychroflexus planctonicus]|uniref:Ribonuclease 3 n=1 Tax=Psychroflexus planctonicus TaxID=1526575 RepID=A0ABQ1SHR6_9FLAO|nr:ribonuclease III [Psychroflexus planctonicus]GGE33869.1 ribonuclease 3 [Psychroflexus planctonicus]
MSFLNKIIKSRSEKNGILYAKIVPILGFKPKNISIYEKAFIHSSAKKLDSFGNEVNYERLEFLGDSILGAVISCYLFDEAPHGDEGYLTKMRSKIVSRKNLNQLGEDLNLIDLLISKVSNKHVGKNIHGNLFEALVGAIYLDKGYKFCETFIYSKIIEPHVDLKKLEGKVISYKSLMIEWCQKMHYQFEYQNNEEDGLDGLKYFEVKLFINNENISKAREVSKKKAEEKASRRAYYVLQNHID